MSTESQRSFGPLEVRRTDEHRPARKDAVSKTDHDAIEPLNKGRIGMGEAIGCAIGDDPYKAYGDTGLITKVVSGEKVPDYLARIFANEGARLRMAKALLRSSGKQVKERTVFEIDERIA